MSEFKSLDELKKGSVEVQEPEEERIIPREGGPDADVNQTITESDYEDEEESGLTTEELAEIQQINELAKNVTAPMGSELDFTDMIQRNTQYFSEIAQEMKEEQIAKVEEQAAENLLNDTFGDEETNQTPVENIEFLDKESEEDDEMIDIGSISQNSFSDVPDDFIEKVLKEEEDEDEDDELTEEDQENLKKQFNEDARKVNERLKELLSKTETKLGETNAVTVSKRPVTIDNFLNRRKSKKVHEAEWVLMCKGKKITMSALSADEIILLDINASSKSKINAIRDAYGVIYDHITSEKPGTFEEWVKTEYAEDLNDYYMCAYRATFENANHFPNVCDNDECNHVFLSENIDIMDMVEFKNDEAKERFNDILNHGNGLDVKPYIETRIIPISDDIAVGLKQPTIYSAVYEYQALPENFVKSKQEMLLIISYIDSFYMIEDGEYRPINVKVYPNNIAKTVRYKIALFSQIIKNLTSDEYGKLITYITAITDKEKALSYHFPDATCPKCGTVVEHDARENGLALLFKRHQLVTTINTWEK